MSASRLISIQFLVASLLVLLGCTNMPATPQTDNPAGLNCGPAAESEQARHLVISAKNDQTFIQCAQNYMNLEKVEEVSFSFCTSMKVSADGQVQSVSIKQSNLPSSLHWCIEQQLWSRNFAGLQLSRGHSINFPTHLKIKKSQ